MEVDPAKFLSKSAVARREFLLEYLGEFGTIVELGAFDNPVFARPLGDTVKYIDWFSKEELIALHQNNPRRNFPRAVDVDFVIKDHLFARHLSEKFDIISGSHVIEHIADVVSWLNQLAMIMKPGGTVFLAVPDKRYTFDYYRKESTAVEMVRASTIGLSKPDVWQLFDHFYYHQKVECDEIWEGKAPPKFRPRFDLAEALKKATKASLNYTDAHCWVFTPESFERSMDDLFVGRFINLHVAHIEPPRAGSNEFWVVLKN